MGNYPKGEMFGAIGAGIAGLSASLYVAKLGMEIHILKKGSTLTLMESGSSLLPMLFTL